VFRIAREESILHLISAKCMSILLHSLDACPVNVADTDKRSLDFMQTRLLMKLFNTGSVDIVHECCVVFNIKSVSSLIVCRRQTFLTKMYMDNRNSICSAVCGLARRELYDLIWLYLWRFGSVCNVVCRINEVNQRRARLVLGWVTVCRRVNHLGM